MRLKNTAFVNNITVNGSSNADWGTELGQSQKHDFTLIGFPEIANAMLYYKIKDIENLKIILGKGNRTPRPFSAYTDNTELVLASLFPKIYINETLLENASLIMCIVKEVNALTSKGEKNQHKGRCQLKFSNSLMYKDESINQKCIDLISAALGSKAWVVLNMEIKNGDELHLYAKSYPGDSKVFSSTKERDMEFDIDFKEISNTYPSLRVYLEKDIAGFVTMYDGKDIPINKLKDIAKTMYDSEEFGPTVNARIQMFGILYPYQIGSRSMEIGHYIKGGSAYGTEIMKGINLGKALRSKIAQDYHNISTSKTSIHPTVQPSEEQAELSSREYSYISAIRTKPFLILGGFSGTGKSQKVKELAFATCPCDGELNISETSPGNYLLVSVKPNWHDATDITGFRSSVNKNYYVTDFMRFLVKAKQYEQKKIPFFVCLDEMNLAPVEEYFADFLSVIESRKRCDDERIVTDALVPASVFNDESYSADFNIFMKLGLQATNSEWSADELNALTKEEQAQAFVRQDIVEDLKQNGLTIPQNVIIIGTVNMDDTTNSFSRKVIDRAMTFETVVGEFGMEYFDKDVALNYVKKPLKGELFISDEVRASQMINDNRFVLKDDEKKSILDFINMVNKDLEGSPFKVSYRILNETILLYRSKKEIERILNEADGIEEGVEFNTDLNTIFDDILMQKVLPRIEGDYEKCSKPLNELLKHCEEKDWIKSEEKINFMIDRFGRDKSGFTSFWN